jgi:hypothetical protein
MNIHSSNGPVATMPGSTHEVPPGIVCDIHPDRKATVRIQGETDNYGCEYLCMCDPCLADFKRQKAALAKEVGYQVVESPGACGQSRTQLDQSSEEVMKIETIDDVNNAMQQLNREHKMATTVLEIINTTNQYKVGLITAEELLLRMFEVLNDAQFPKMQTLQPGDRDLVTGHVIPNLPEWCESVKAAEKQ